jgi:RHS repeat-associated protein
VNANRQLGQLMPYQFTGGYTDGNTGLVQLDARWYNPHSSRFQQPDYWNLRNTHLPTAIQHELMRFTGLNTAQLINDPSQQLAYGYVSGNPLAWVDPLGLNLIEDTVSIAKDLWSYSINDEGNWNEIKSELGGVASRAVSLAGGVGQIGLAGALISGTSGLGTTAGIVVGAKGLDNIVSAWTGNDTGAVTLVENVTGDKELAQKISLSIDAATSIGGLMNPKVTVNAFGNPVRKLFNKLPDDTYQKVTVSGLLSEGVGVLNGYQSIDRCNK